MLRGRQFLCIVFIELHFLFWVLAAPLSAAHSGLICYQTNGQSRVIVRLDEDDAGLGRLDAGDEIRGTAVEEGGAAARANHRA